MRQSVTHHPVPGGEPLAGTWTDLKPAMATFLQTLHHTLDRLGNIERIERHHCSISIDARQSQQIGHKLAHALGFLLDQGDLLNLILGEIVERRRNRLA